MALRVHSGVELRRREDGAELEAYRMEGRGGLAYVVQRHRVVMGRKRLLSGEKEPSLQERRWWVEANANCGGRERGVWEPEMSESLLSEVEERIEVGESEGVVCSWRRRNEGIEEIVYKTLRVR